MPEFLEKKLRAEYGNNAHAIYGTMNKIGAMKGNKETAKGREMEKEHMEKEHATPFRSTHIDHHSDGSHTVRHEPHMKPSKSPAFVERVEDTSYSAEDGHALMAKLHEHLGIAHEGEAGDGGGDSAQEE